MAVGKKSSLGHSRFKEGERIEKISVAVSTVIGVGEVIVALMSSSVALMADGILSFADAGVALIVFFGLSFTKRMPDNRFHFGYYKVETLAAFGAAIVMSFSGILILIGSYNRLLAPIALEQPFSAMAAALLASVVSTAFAVYKIMKSRKIGSSAMRVDALNSVKDSFSSILVLVSLSFATSGFLFMDAVAGILMAVFIFSVAYVTIKESALTLLDACNCPDVLEQMKWAAIGVEGVQSVKDVRLRKVSGMILCEVVLGVDRNMTVQEANDLAREVEKAMKEDVENLEYLTIRTEPVD